MFPAAGSGYQYDAQPLAQPDRSLATLARRPLAAG